MPLLYVGYFAQFQNFRQSTLSLYKIRRETRWDVAEPVRLTILELCPYVVLKGDPEPPKMVQILTMIWADYAWSFCMICHGTVWYEQVMRNLRWFCVIYDGSTSLEVVMRDSIWFYVICPDSA